VLSADNTYRSTPTLTDYSAILILRSFRGDEQEFQYRR
jgi:hypothetical protein